MTTLLDTHYHYDFVPEQARGPLLDALAKEGVSLVAQTVTPSGFVNCESAEVSRTSSAPVPLLSVGFHPWYIESDYQQELDVFAEALTRTRFVGEIGLDFAPRRLEQVTAKKQVEVFRRILTLADDAARSAGNQYVLSIHTVRSATEVLDQLEDTSAVVPVFHRFGGTSDELTRLIRAGGYVSVNPLMLNTKRGRAYVTQVPADRLLLETDLPTSAHPEQQPDYAHDIITALRSTVADLAKLRKTDENELTDQIEANSNHLYGR